MPPMLQNRERYRRASLFALRVHQRHHHHADIHAAPAEVRSASSARLSPDVTVVPSFLLAGGSGSAMPRRPITASAEFHAWRHPPPALPRRPGDRLSQWRPRCSGTSNGASCVILRPQQAAAAPHEACLSACRRAMRDAQRCHQRLFQASRVARAPPPPPSTIPPHEMEVEEEARGQRERGRGMSSRRRGGNPCCPSARHACKAGL